MIRNPSEPSTPVGTGLVEAVPNFSEGRRPEVVRVIRDAIASEPGVTMLDVSSDPWHNRSVITFIAPANRMLDGAYAGIRAARDHIDLRSHDGVHPRIGAADVVPFVPLHDTTMDVCVELARTLGARVGSELGVPVYLYERAAARSDRRRLAEVRRGGFEGLREAIAIDPARAPDFGPAHVHPTAGAVAIGARPLLVAYNVYIGPARHIDVARRIAREIRESAGGVPGIRALGLVVDEQSQVSMNLVDIERTALREAWEAVRAAAAPHGLEPTSSEIVGLVPERALRGTSADELRLQAFSPDMILEQRIRQLRTAGLLHVRRP